MERIFHEHFYQTNREITVAELARMSQASDESPRDYLQRFKTCRNWCRTNLLEREFVKMAEEGLEFEYRKKSQGIEFRDMHDLINKVDRYASLLKEEVQKRTASKGTYYRNPVVNYAEADNPTEADGDEVEMSSAEVSIDKPFVCKGLVKADNSRTKIPDAKFATQETKAYTFDLTRAEAIFDLLLTEKKVKLSFGHKIPKPEELKGKTFCKYHSSWSHNTNNCVVLRDVIQKLIDEKKHQFPEKAAMQVDSKPFPPPVINMVNAQLRAEYREVRWPAKGKEPLAEPEPVPCSRCKSEIGQQDHSAIDLYGMTPENREIVELALRNAKAERLLITNESDSAIKAVYQANREARARGMPADTIFGLTTEERAQVSRLDDYLAARDTLPKARQALEEEVGTSDPPKTKAATDDTPGTARPMAEGPGDLLFGHEAEDDPTLGISDDDYDGILEMIEQKTLASGGREVNKGAGRGNQRKPKEVSMNMVLVLPSEFSAPRGQTNGLDNDVVEEQLDQRPKTKEELLAVTFNEVIPKDEPNKYRHLKPLYISAHVEGVPVSKVFVDCGETVNILPYSLMKKLDKSKEDLIPSDVVMSSFVGDKSKTIGVLPLKITVADQTRVAAFYVVESSMDYNILLGRDWIHKSGCIPSSLFQLLFFWDG
ncbi:unnamed protein product [Prunus armeniaca]